MKRLDPAHLRLLSAAVRVRDQLRRIESSKLDRRTAEIIVSCVHSLSAGLKAREYRSNRTGGAAQ